MVARARRIFNLDADAHSACRSLRTDTVIGPLVEGRPGLRPPGTWDPFESRVRAIVGQQVSVAGANTVTARIVERHGTPVGGLGVKGPSHLFPSPAVLAAADLADLGLTTARARAVSAFAGAVVDGRVDLDGSRSLDHSSRRSRPRRVSARGRPSTSRSVSANPTSSRPATSGSGLPSNA